MPEMVCESKTLIVQMLCDKCEDGIMEFTGEALCTYPSQYIHKCQSCGHTESYFTYYPTKRVIPIEPLRYPTEDEKKD